MNSDIKTVLSTVFHVKEEEININMTKDDISTWDSLTHMDLITSLEEKFSVSFEIQDIIIMDTIKSIIEVLKRKGVEIDS